MDKNQTTDELQQISIYVLTATVQPLTPLSKIYSPKFLYWDLFVDD